MKKLVTLFLFLSIWVWVLNTCNPGEYQHLQWQKIELRSFEEIRAEISHLKNTPVKIQGTVDFSFYTSFFGGGFYSIKDATGAELLITTKGDVCPKVGEKLTVIVVPKVIVQINNAVGITNAEIQRVRMRP